MKKKSFPIFLIIISCFSFTQSDRTAEAKKKNEQAEKINSLSGILKIDKGDPTKIIYLNSLSARHGDISNYDSNVWRALVSTNSLPSSLSTLKKIGTEWLSGVASTYNDIGITYYIQGNYPKALDYYLKALKIGEEIDDKTRIALEFNNIGLICFYQGNFPKAFEYFLEALKINEELRNKIGIAVNLVGLGNVSFKERNYSKALNNYFKALTIAEELKDKNEIAICLGEIGNVYTEQGEIGNVYTKQKNYLRAIDCYFKVLKINEELGKGKEIAACLGNIGIIYDEQNDNVKALTYYFKALKMAEELGYKNGIATHLFNIGMLYNKTKKYKEAEKYLSWGLTICDSIGALYEKVQFETLLSELYAQTGKYQKAFEYYKKAMIAKDMLFNEDSKKQIIYKEILFEFEKKEAAIKAEQEKKNMLVKADANRNKIIATSIIVLLSTIGILLLQRQRLNRKKDKIIFENKQALSEKETALLKLEKRRIEDDLASSKKILDNYTESILEKNKILEQINTEMEDLKNLKSKELYEENIKRHDFLKKATILTDDDWDKFKELFEQVYKGFFIRLKEKLPDLTAAEIRLICLTKLKLSPKQMASILGISTGTIRTTRYRLRKKLNLPETENIEDISHSI
jgi:tetratricopeptide (TPR) repeat protein